MSDKDLYVDVANLKGKVAKLQGQVEALENIVYKREPKTTGGPQPIQQVLKDLDVSLSDRLEVVSEQEVRAREYFHNKDDWSTINKLLKQHGFKWVSMGKQSCWRRQ